MNKKTLLVAVFILTAIAQLYFPLRTIITNEAMISKNRIYRFKVMSVDPNDAFRGKFLSMTLADNKFTVDREMKRGDKAFVTIKEDPLGFAGVTGFYRDENAIPKGAEYMRVTVNWAWKKSDKWDVNVDYPFNRYYINEKSSDDIQKAFSLYYNECIAEVGVGGGNAVLLNVLLKGEPIEKYAANHREKELTRDEVLKQGTPYKLRVKPLVISNGIKPQYPDFHLPVKGSVLKRGDIIYVKFRKDAAGYDVPESMETKPVNGGEMVRVSGVSRGTAVFSPIDSPYYNFKESKGYDELLYYIKGMGRKNAYAQVRLKGSKCEIESFFIEGIPAAKYADSIARRNLEDYGKALKTGVYFKIRIIGQEDEFPGDEEVYLSKAINGAALICRDFDNAEYDEYDLYHIPLEKLANGMTFSGTPQTCRPASGNLIKGHIYRYDEKHTMFVIRDNIRHIDEIFEHVEKYDEKSDKDPEYLTMVMTRREIFLVNITAAGKVIYDFYGQKEGTKNQVLKK